MSTTRRHFLLGAGAATLATAAGADTPADAASRLRVALVGLGGRASSHLKCLLALAGDKVELAALCDVDAVLLGQRVAAVERQTGKKPIAYDDMRRVFEDKTIDAVCFATPNHWHALGTIWACQAGKDVYVEKPAGHNISEGRLAVAPPASMAGSCSTAPSAGPARRSARGSNNCTRGSSAGSTWPGAWPTRSGRT